LWQAAQDAAWEATALYLISGVYIRLRDKPQAFAFAQRALPIAQAAAKQPDDERRRLGVKVEAIALETLGLAHNEFGDKQQALAFFQQALARKRAIEDRAGELVTLN